MKKQPNKHDQDHCIDLNECQRCGTCCKKGGPAFHACDRHLIDSGKIPLKFLYTIRRNEPARDNVKGKIQPVISDIIKIKGQKGSWGCCFFDRRQNQCTIYNHRPLECRVLKCWDTKEIEVIYDQDRLTREDLVSEINGLWELIQEHEIKCSYKKMEALIQDLKKNEKKKTVRQIIEMVEYDTQIRNLLMKRSNMDSEILEFLFGRPFRTTIELYGIKLEKGESGHILRIN